MDLRTILDLFIVFLIFIVLRPLVTYLLKINISISNITYGIAAILSFGLLLTEPEGMVRNSYGFLIIVYFVYAWWVDRKIDIDNGDVQ